MKDILLLTNDSKLMIYETGKTFIPDFNIMFMRQQLRKKNNIYVN